MFSGNFAFSLTDHNLLAASCQALSLYFQSVDMQCKPMPLKCPRADIDPLCIPPLRVDGNISVSFKHLSEMENGKFVSEVSGTSINISVTDVGEEGSVSLLLSSIPLLVLRRLSDGVVINGSFSGLLGVGRLYPVRVRNEVFEVGGRSLHNVIVEIANNLTVLSIDRVEYLHDVILLSFANECFYLVLMGITSGIPENTPFPAVFKVCGFKNSTQIPLTGLHLKVNKSLDNVAGNFLEVIEEKNAPGELLVCIYLTVDCIVFDKYPVDRWI